MNVRHNRQRTLFEPLAKQLLPDYQQLALTGWLAKLDQLLEDEQMIDLVDEALSRRYPLSRRRGRKSTPSEVVLRLSVLRRLNGWTFDQTEFEVRGNLHYRDFTRLGHGRMPDAKTLIRLEKAIGPATLDGIVNRLSAIAEQKKVTTGRKMRVDTTVIETNIRYPADSNLLGDCLRVVTRTVKKINEAVGSQRIKFRNRSRSVKHRLIEIGKAARQRGEEGKKKIERSYVQLLSISRRALTDANKAITKSGELLKEEVESVAREKLEKLVRTLEETVELTRRIIKQTEARVIDKDDHYKGKVLSIFEPQTEAIRKGKAGKPTEFGTMIKIQEADNGVITAYEVYEVRPADSDLLMPAIDKHKQLFGRAPDLVAADAGFFSAANESNAKQAGVKRVAIPSKRSKSAERRRIEKQRWFRRAQRWRVGCEGTISVLKRGYGLHRCPNRGDPGMKRWVGWGVIACTLVRISKLI